MNPSKTVSRMNFRDTVQADDSWTVSQQRWGSTPQVESVRPTIGDSDTESVFQSTPDQSGDEDIARVPETVVVEDVLEDVEGG